MSKMNENVTYRASNLSYNGIDENKQSSLIFNNLPDLIVPELAAKLLNKSVKTLYDWKYRGKTRKEKIPPNLFVKIGGSLYLNKKTLIDWVFYRSSS